MGGAKKKLDRLRKELAKKQRLSGLGAGGETIPYALIVETDRGCALVASEYVNDALEALLLAKFDKEGTPKEIKADLVGSFIAPLGSLAMRARACRAFGIINQDTYDAIDALREIRNACGHRKGRIDLQDKEISKYVRWLEKYIGRYPMIYPDGRAVEGWAWWDDRGKELQIAASEFTKGAHDDYERRFYSDISPSGARVLSKDRPAV